MPGICGTLPWVDDWFGLARGSCSWWHCSLGSRALMREHRMPTTSPRSVAELSNSKTKLYAEAVSIAERHVEWARQQHGEDHLAYGRAMAVLAKAYHSQGRYAEAEPLYKKKR